MKSKLLVKLSIVSLLCLVSACNQPGTQVKSLAGATLAFQTDKADRTALVEVQWARSGNLALQGWSLPSNQAPIYIGDIKTKVMSRPVVDNRPISGIHPVLSPTGRLLAYYDFDREQTLVVRLDEPPTACLMPLVGDIDWSPDEQKMVVLAGITNTVTMRIVDVQGRELEQIFDLSDHRLQGGGDIAWSPNGELVAFSLTWESDIAGQDQGDIYILSRTTRQVTRVTNTPAMNDRWPSWSPDSQRLVFSSAPLGTPAEVTGRLVFSSSDSSCINTVPNLEGVGSLSWSPDGSMIAVVSEGGVYALPIASLGEEFGTSQLKCHEQ